MVIFVSSFWNYLSFMCFWERLIGFPAQKKSWLVPFSLTEVFWKDRGSILLKSKQLESKCSECWYQYYPNYSTVICVRVCRQTWLYFQIWWYRDTCTNFRRSEVLFWCRFWFWVWQLWNWRLNQVSLFVCWFICWLIYVTYLLLYFVTFVYSIQEEKPVLNTVYSSQNWYLADRQFT